MSAPAASPPPNDPEPGAMTRRLEQATQDALISSPRSAARSIQEGTFSPQLKDRLLSQLASKDLSPVSSFQQALSQASLPASASASVRADAAAAPWTGEESTEQVARRMLEDAHKPLPPELRGKPAPSMDMRLRREPRRTPGERAADARDRAAAYVDLSLEGRDKAGGLKLNDSEREVMKREFRERFSPDAREMPASVSALASLANKRCVFGDFWNSVGGSSRADFPQN